MGTQTKEITDLNHTYVEFTARALLLENLWSLSDERVSDVTSIHSPLAKRAVRPVTPTRRNR